MKLVTLVFCIIEGTINFFLLSAAILALASQAVSQLNCSSAPEIYYYLIAGTDCKKYYRNLNGIISYHTFPADLRFNVDQVTCGCDSSDFVCPA